MAHFTIRPDLSRPLPAAVSARTTERAPRTHTDDALRYALAISPNDSHGWADLQLMNDSEAVFHPSEDNHVPHLMSQAINELCRVTIRHLRNGAAYDPGLAP